MDARSKLALIWLVSGLTEIVFAHVFIARKRDPFADPNSWLAAKWIQSVRNVQTMTSAAMDAGLASREWLVRLTVTTMTQMGVGLIVLGGLLFVHPWSTTTAIIISVVWIVALVAVSLAVFVMTCIRCSKKG